MLAFLKTIPNESPDAISAVIVIILYLLVGFFLLLTGGKWLVDGAVSIAKRLGISTLVIGLTIVAFGTSAPELALNIVAAVDGQTGLAFGNVVGSNIANVGLVIGISALVAPLLVSSRIIKLELPWLMVITGLFVLLTWLPPGVADAPGYGLLDGILLVLGAVAIAIHWYWIGRRESNDTLSSEAVKSEVDDRSGLIERSVPLSCLLLILGLCLLVGGGKLVEIGAIDAARAMGIGEVLIGLTIVAIATTLPEIATCVIAARNGQSDLAIGTVVGSNLFNLVLVMGFTSIVHPVAVPEIGGWWSLGAMLVFTLLLWPLALTKRSVGRFEGLLLLALYIAFIVGSIWIETDRPAGDAVETTTHGIRSDRQVVVDHAGGGWHDRSLHVGRR
ncbi:MAG: sodium:calcium antiporter [Phycisphaerae bacterium]|nr:sodium:calcium antiporter [Phycisphaerae bacterium]|tara:strand:- start:6445 stop:7611 length:1167 start_codon:yes stop_codon:yes gene_type:complete